MLLAGLLTRLATVPLIIDMLVAIASTKLPILVKSGFWAMAHEARPDYAMLLGSIFFSSSGPARSPWMRALRNRRSAMPDKAAAGPGSAKPSARAKLLGGDDHGKARRFDRARRDRLGQWTEVCIPSIGASAGGVADEEMLGDLGAFRSSLDLLVAAA